MPEGVFRVRMSEVPLHVLDGGMALDMRRRSAPECLMRKIVDADGLCEPFQMAFPIVSDAECSPN
jgi:hypothetical protein